MPHDILHAICSREGLDATTARPLPGGQSNHVYLLEGRYVVRLGRGADARRRLEGEAALLARLPAEVLAPRIAAGGRLEDWTYQVQPRLEGRPLHHLWTGLSPETKDALVAQLAAALRALHAVPVEGYGPATGADAERHGSWRARCEEAFAALVGQLGEVGYALPEAVTAEMARFWAEHADALEPSRPSLVHGDIWPGNLLVEGDRLVAIVDWELAAQAPPDNELLILEHFLLYPNDYVEEDREVYCAADFADLALLLAAHYPELLATPRLRERLDLYQLLYILDVHVGWARAHGTEGGAPWSLLAKASNVLSAHGVRMFPRVPRT